MNNENYYDDKTMSLITIISLWKHEDLTPEILNMIWGSFKALGN